MKNKRQSKKKALIEETLTDMINNGSEGVTTLSYDVEAKYEAIDKKDKSEN